MEQPDLRMDFHFEVGQMQFVNNRQIAHKQTAFRGWPEPERKRHLVRLWLRDRGRPFYNGSLATDMAMRALLISLCLGLLGAGCSSLPVPCPPRAGATGSGGSVTQAEAQVTWTSGGCSGLAQ